jgi:hypothetical protein
MAKLIMLWTIVGRSMVILLIYITYSKVEYLTTMSIPMVMKRVNQLHICEDEQSDADT